MDRENRYILSEEMGYVWVCNGCGVHLPVVSDGDSAGSKGNVNMKATRAFNLPDSHFGSMDPGTISKEAKHAFS